MTPHSRRALTTLAVAALVFWSLAPEERGRSTPEETEPTQTTAIRVTVTPPEPARAADPPTPVPPPPRPTPRPRPVSATTDAPRKLEPDPALVRRGEALLDAGRFPRLRATYARIGFSAYRDAMLALGGRFYLFDADRRATLAEVDPLDGSLRARAPDGSLSRWPRDVTRHAPSALARGHAVYGARAQRVVLLPPRTVDAALLGALDAGLRAANVDPRELRDVGVAYELHAGRLRADVLHVGLRDGSKLNPELVIDLTPGGLPS